jgi:hypothetical protein
MGFDIARAQDGLGVGVATPFAERAVGTTHWRVDRWDADQTRWVKTCTGLVAPTADDFRRLKVASYRTTELVGNLITNAGWTRLMNLLTAQGGTQALSATATRIGVGNSNTAEAYTDTDLGASAGSSNRYFQPVSGAGSLGTRTLAFSATFGTSDGNFAWNEFGIDVGTPTVSGGTTVNALLFNHKAGIAQGTKASGQTWTATATLTFS